MLGLDAVQSKVDQVNGGDLVHRGRALGAPGAAGERRHAARHHLVGRHAGGRRDHHLPADAAHRAPRAGPVGRARSRREPVVAAAPRATWWCWRARPTRARRARSWRRCSSARACAPAATSTWRSRPSGSTPGASTGPRAPPRRWSAGSPRSAPGAPWTSTPRPATRWSRSASPEVAELTKLLENIFRSVNIALVNELAMLCDRMGIDVWEVIDAAATKPFGFMPFRPGPGLGRPLHPDRPLLPHVEGAGVRPAHGVHRAGRARSTRRCRASAWRRWRARSTAAARR